MLQTPDDTHAVVRKSYARLAVDSGSCCGPSSSEIGYRPEDLAALPDEPSAALPVIEPRLVAISFVGAVVVNLVIAINHRRDRYIAT